MRISFRKHDRRLWGLILLFVVAAVAPLARNLLDPGADFNGPRWLLIGGGLIGLTIWLLTEGLEFRRTPPGNG